MTEKSCTTCVHAECCGDYDENDIAPICWEESYEEECWYCDGYGYLPNEGDADCPYCDGTGKIPCL